MLSSILLAAVNGQTIADILSSKSYNTSLVWDAIQKTSNATFLKPGNITFFAPTNEAIKTLNATFPGYFSEVVNDVSKLGQLVQCNF